MTATEWIFGILAMALFALMCDMAVLGISPYEFIETIKCYW